MRAGFEVVAVVLISVGVWLATWTYTQEPFEQTRREALRHELERTKQAAVEAAERLQCSSRMCEERHACGRR